MSIEVKINALKEGSFLVHILLQFNLVGQIGDFFTKENIEIASGIVTIVGGIYSTAKFLKGKKGTLINSPDKTTTIKNEFGNTTIIDNRVYTIYKIIA